MIKFIKLAFENMNYQLKLNQILDEFKKKDISLDSYQKDITEKILLLAIKIKDETPFKIFTKASQAGWKAFIPFLNLFVFTKVVEKPVWFIALYLILPIGYLLSAFQIAKSFGKNITFSIGLIFLPIVFFPLLAFGKSEYKKEK